MPRKVKEEEPMRSGWREAGGILLAGMSILMFLSMMSYDPNDMSAIQMPPNNPPGNYIGPFGAWLSFLLFMTFGIAAYAVPFISGALSLFMIFRRRGRVWPKALWLGGLTVSLLCLVELNPEAWSERMHQLNLAGPGGATGQIIGQWLFIGLMGRGGTTVISITLLLASIVFLSELKIGHVTTLSGAGLSKLQTQLKIWQESPPRTQENRTPCGAKAAGSRSRRAGRGGEAGSGS